MDVADPRGAAFAYARSLNGSEVTDIANTGSMNPYITNNNFGVIEKVPFDSLRPGDIAVYQSNWAKDAQGHPAKVIHELWNKTDSGWEIEGLNKRNTLDPQRVTADNYIGVVRKIWRPLGPAKTP